MNRLKRVLFVPKKPEENMKHNNSHNLVTDYAENATAHGVGKIKSSKNTFVRLFWITVFSIFIGCVAKQIYDLAIKITSNDYNTHVQSKVYRSGLIFPAVTICNSNAFSVFKLQKIFQNKNPNVTEWTDDDVSLERMNALQKIMVTFNKTQMKNLGQQPEMIFMPDQCKFNGEKCRYPEDFRIVISPKSGNCFTFNDNGTLLQPKLGTQYGLFIILNIDQDSYNAFHDEDIPIAAGVTISIHNANQSLNLQNNAILAGPNQLTRIAIRKKGVARLKAPFIDNCTDSGPDIKLFYPGSYTVDSCLSTCYILRMNLSCNAVNLASALLASQQAGLKLKLAITNADVKCVAKFDDSFKDGKINCDCQVLCNDETYETTVSSATWPANAEIDFLIRRMNQNITRDYFKDNLLALQIYYDDLTVETTIHKPAYDSNAFLSDLGGQLGLWIGGSFFSVLEVFVLLSALLMHCIVPTKIVTKKNNGENKDISEHHELGAM